MLANGATLGAGRVDATAFASQTRAPRVWALPLIATSPVWLIVTRTGIEVGMFTPLLGVLGLYLLMLRTPWAAFGAGVSWGLLVYNHLIGLSFRPRTSSNGTFGNSHRRRNRS